MTQTLNRAPMIYQNRPNLYHIGDNVHCPWLPCDFDSYLSTPASTKNRVFTAYRIRVRVMLRLPSNPVLIDYSY